jgi:hypothetical protein
MSDEYTEPNRMPAFSVSVHDDGDCWYATHKPDDLPLMALRFPKNQWHKDNVSGMMLMCAQQQRIKLNPPPPIWEQFKKRGYNRKQK